MELPIAPGGLPWVLTAVVFVGLAIWLMLLDPGSRLNQAFALFLVIRGMHNGLWAFQSAVVPPFDPADFATRVNVYFEIVIPFATLYFLYVYMRGFGSARRRPFIPILLLCGALVSLSLYVVFPELRFGADGLGPIVLVAGLKFITYAATALILGVEFTRSTSKSRRHALYLVALGFMLDPLWIATLFGVYMVMAGAGLFDFGTSVYGWIVPSLMVLSFIPLGALAWFIARRARTTNDPQVRSECRRFLAFMAVPVASALLVHGLFFTQPVLANQFQMAFNGIWVLVLGLLVIAAITRHQLLGVDVKLKWTLRSGTLFAFFLFLFFVISAGTQAMLEHRTGSALIGVLGAGVIVFLISPLHRIAERMANAAMPGVKPIQQMGPEERAALFREWTRLAWSDGTLTAKERHMLDHARERLGISLQEAVQYEKDAVPG